MNEGTQYNVQSLNGILICDIVLSYNKRKHNNENYVLVNKSDTTLNDKKLLLSMLIIAFVI